MKRISYCFLLAALFVAPFHPLQSTWAGPKTRATKSDSKVKPLKVKEPPLRGLPDYLAFEKAKNDFLGGRLSLRTLQSHQKTLRTMAWNSSSRTFQKEVEDLYWMMEINRAESIPGQDALDVWMHSLQSLNQFKWLYAWTETTSQSLVRICKKQKTKSKVASSTLKLEKCDYLVKRVNDAFPKGAMETLPLKPLISDSTGSIDANLERFDRLGQTYSEKKEKDEEAFAEVLEHYLNRRDDDLDRSGKAFNEAFPRSMLRFRSMFLMAERLFSNDEKKEAEKYYLQIIEQIPYSYYAIVASERLGRSLSEKIGEEPLPELNGLEELKLNLFEKDSLCKVENLVRLKKEEPVAIELEQFGRIRTYPTSFLTYLFQKAHESKQDLAGFRFATEILQRKGEAPLKRAFVNMVFPDRFQKEIADQAKLSKIDPLLVISLMKQESGFKRSILSSSGAMGLMQLMPFTALEVQKDLYLRKLREPSKNIEVGTKYLASLLNDKFNGNVVYALAGYNAGPTRVGKWRKDAKPDWGMQEFVEAIPYKETRDYVMSILRNRYWYQYRMGMKPQSVFEAWRTP